LPAAEPAARGLGAPEMPDGTKIPASSADQAYTREQLRDMGLLQQATSRVKYSKDAPPPFVPKDPFDPEIFNRRFFGK
jgi:hypothetical protein